MQLNLVNPRQTVKPSYAEERLTNAAQVGAYEYFYIGYREVKSRMYSSYYEFLTSHHMQLLSLSIQMLLNLL
jgi:hypothetical protein